MSIFDSNFFDSANDLLNKGASKVSGAIDSASNKVKLTEQQHKREEACAALGAVAYAALKDDVEFRARFEEQVAAIEEIDAIISQVEAQIAAAEEEKAAVARAKAGMRVCGNCGAALPDDAIFCGNCGTRVPEPEPAPEPEVDLVCAMCGESVLLDAAFCPNCGAKI